MAPRSQQAPKRVKGDFEYLCPIERPPKIKSEQEKELLAEEKRKAEEAKIKAAAPSLTPEALPAVTVPPPRKGVGRAVSCSRVV